MDQSELEYTVMEFPKENKENTNSASMPPTPASNCEPVIGSEMSEMLNNEVSEAPEADQSCPETSQTEPQSIDQHEHDQETNTEMDTETQSAADNLIDHFNDMEQKQIKVEPTSSNTSLTMLTNHHDHASNSHRHPPALEPPPLHPPPGPPPLQQCHRSIPSNQANIVNNCITGFQSTFSQEHMGLPDPCKPTCEIIHRPNTNPHYPDHHHLPSPCNQYPGWPNQQPQQHCHHNQYANYNNNASPTSYEGFEKPRCGLVQQIVEVYKSSGKKEMQPSEVYYELEKQFPYYRYLDPQRRKSWTSSVRHALTSPQFKSRRCTDEDGKPANRRGNFWSIDENFIPGESSPHRNYTYRRRSKVMSPGGRRGGYMKNYSSPGQMFPEQLAGASMMSPQFACANVTQANTMPMILPAPQIAGQTVQLLPAVNSGINVSQTFPKQTAVASNGQIVWLNNPQQQQLQHVQHNGNTWGNAAQITTINPAFNGNIANNNYNFSNNIQQIQQNQQIQQQHQQRLLLHQQQQQQQQALQNTALFQYTPAPRQTLHQQKYFTTGQRVNVVGGNIVPALTTASSHLQQQQPAQVSSIIRTSNGQTSSCSTVMQALAQQSLAQIQQGQPLQPLSQQENIKPDVGPGGDPSPNQPSNDGSETIANLQDSQTTTEDDIVRRAVQSEIMNALEEIKSECEEQLSSDQPSSQTENELFPVTLYASSSTSNPEHEKTVVPSVEALTNSLTNQTCAAMAQASDTTLTERESATNENSTVSMVSNNDKNSEDSKSELRAMVFNEVCNTEDDQTSAVSTVLPNSQMNSSNEQQCGVVEPNGAEPSSMVTNMDTVSLAQSANTSEQWNP